MINTERRNKTYSSLCIALLRFANFCINAMVVGYRCPDRDWQSFTRFAHSKNTHTHTLLSLSRKGNPEDEINSFRTANIDYRKLVLLIKCLLKEGGQKRLNEIWRFVIQSRRKTLQRFKPDWPHWSILAYAAYGIFILGSIPRPFQLFNWISSREEQQFISHVKQVPSRTTCKYVLYFPTLY